jgi:hypothetical protein
MHAFLPEMHETALPSVIPEGKTGTVHLDDRGVHPPRHTTPGPGLSPQLHRHAWCGYWTGPAAGVELNQELVEVEWRVRRYRRSGACCRGQLAARGEVAWSAEAPRSSRRSHPGRESLERLYALWPAWSVDVRTCEASRLRSDREPPRANEQPWAAAPAPCELSASWMHQVAGHREPLWRSAYRRSGGIGRQMENGEGSGMADEGEGSGTMRHPGWCVPHQVCTTSGVYPGGCVPHQRDEPKRSTIVLVPRSGRSLIWIHRSGRLPT